MVHPLVSIALVTKNGAATLPAVLDALSRQRRPVPIEIVAVDSGSTDGTVELLRPRVNRLVEIRAGDFNHGLTRNLAVASTAGDLVVMLVQDAVPEGDQWLASLVAPLVAEPEVAGAFARQVARRDASALTRAYLSRAFVTGARPRTVSATAAEIERLPPIARLDRCTFDNVCSCIRRSVWSAIPFREVPIAEDVAWGYDALVAGHRLAFVPDAVVVHSHDRPARDELARTRALHAELGTLFGLRTIPSAGALARAIAGCAVAHVWLERRAPARLPRALALAVAWPLGQYLGGRRAGRRPARPGLSA